MCEFHKIMGLVGEVVSEIEVNANADKFFHFFKHEIFHTPNISSKFIQQVELHEGDWDIHAHGSIKIWNYTIGMHKTIATSTTIIITYHEHLFFFSIIILTSSKNELIYINII